MPPTTSFAARRKARKVGQDVEDESVQTPYITISDPGELSLNLLKRFVLILHRTADG